MYRCPKCKARVLKAVNKEYFMECLSCDEDFYKFELIEEDETKESEARENMFSGWRSCLLGLWEDEKLEDVKEHQTLHMQVIHSLMIDLESPIAREHTKFFEVLDEMTNCLRSLESYRFERKMGTLAYFQEYRAYLDNCLAYVDICLREMSGISTGYGRKK